MDSRGNVAEGKNVSSKAIRKKVKNTLSVALKRYKIDSYILLDLDKVLNDVYCSFRPVSADYDTRKELVKNLNAMAIDIYGNSEETCPVLEAYGSFVMDMYSPQSDLDVSINFGNGTSELPREKKLKILKRFAKKLCSLEGDGHVRNVESIFTAKVPIVKFCDQGTAVECDLSVGNKDGILNSQIIRIISQIDGRFQKLCMLVKYWAKAHEVNSALHRTLNSVSITLLVALHLQTQNPPILPPFSLLFKDGIDPPNVEKRTQKFLNWGQRNQESLGTLFATFFIKLQSVEFLWRQGLCVSVLNGLWISKKWKKVGVGSISVEDFTDVFQNVARRVNGAGAKKIYSSINRTVDDIFEFLNDKVAGTDLRHKLFGQKAVVQLPPVASLSEKTAGIHRVFGQQAVVEPPPPPVPPFNGKIAVTHLKQKVFDQQAEPSPPVPPLNGNIAGTHLKHKVIGQQAVVEPPPPVPLLNGKIARTHLKQKVFSQQAVAEPSPSVPPLNGNIAGTYLKHKVIGQQAVVEPSPPVPPLNGKIARTHLKRKVFSQQAVAEPSPSVPPLNGNMAGTHLKRKVFGQQAVVEPRPHVPPLNGNIAGRHLKRKVLSQQAVAEPSPSVPPLNGNIAGTHLKHKVFSQQAVVEPRPHVPPLNGNIAGRHLRDRVFGQQAVVEPRSHVLPLHGNIAGRHLKHRVFDQQAVVQPRPPVPPLYGNIAGTHLSDRLFGHQAVLQPRPPVPPLNGNIAETHLRDRLFDQHAVLQPRPPVPPFNSNIAGTHLRDRLFDQQSVVEPRPPMPSLNVYPQQPHNNYRNGFSSPPEEHYNKRVCLVNGYRAVEETGHRREEERYEDLRGKRNRCIGNYNGFEEFCEIPRFGIHSKPLDDQYRQVPLNDGTNDHFVHHRHDGGRYSGEEPMPMGQWQDYSRRIGPPPPQPLPPYGRDSYENFRRQNLNQSHFGRSFYK